MEQRPGVDPGSRHVVALLTRKRITRCALFTHSPAANMPPVGIVPATTTHAAQTAAQLPKNDTSGSTRRAIRQTWRTHENAINATNDISEIKMK